MDNVIDGQAVMLGDMILLGDTLRPRNSESWTGCAIGGAFKAMGCKVPDPFDLLRGSLTPARTIRLSFPWLDKVPFTSYGVYPTLYACLDSWGPGMFMISEMFVLVCRNQFTIEELAAKVNYWQNLYGDAPNAVPSVAAMLNPAVHAWYQPAAISTRPAATPQTSHAGEEVSQ